MELLPPVPDPWPQVVEQGFAVLVAMVQAWESSAPDENKTPEKRFWQSGQSAIAQTISLLLQKAWLFQADNMEGSALPPLSCVNDASVLLEFVMSSVTCMEETESLKVFELVATWADAIANWDSWEEMEDQGVFNTIKEVVNFHQRFDLDGLFLKTHFVRCHSTRYSFCHGSVLIHAGHSSRSEVILSPYVVRLVVLYSKHNLPSV
ncbi:uncharacterized protein [Zea mays]|uniref:uncharacterized protein n=1 Tax=Zea mays TaxID=4577 RepID=UPI0009A96749|nr:uncharacterized protein LOC103653725 [Zea mays]|eukprot:XP_020407465.1 uncharacterized protein LOC103653725 [Zea mays]